MGATGYIFSITTNTTNLSTLKKTYRYVNKPVVLHSIVAEVILLIPRVVCGFLLAKDFGASKFGMPWTPAEKNLGLFEVGYWFPADVAEYGGIFAMFPIFFAWMAAFSEAVGGVFLLIGFNTRLSSFLITVTMLVAIFAQQWNNGLWNMLAAMGFLWVAMYCLVFGSGKFGLDNLLDKKLKRSV